MSRIVPPIGIDLGTSTSEICAYRNNEAYVIPDPSSLNRSPIVPSLVACNKKGELVVGEEARAYVDLPGQGVREAKRKMGSGETVVLMDRKCRPEEISAVILRKLKENAEEALGCTLREVVLSVPANFPDAARQATLNAGELAGLRITRLINEPTAAALAFGIKNIDAEEQVVVFDFGGGTLDITVLEMMAGVLDVKASFGDPFLGGKDFDEAMTTLVLRKFQAEHPRAQISEKSRMALKGAAERAKVALSGQRSHQVQLPYFAVDRGEPIDLEVEISRDEFERSVAGLLDRTRECVRQALAAKKIRPSAIDRVLLVGGTTYIPCIRRVVAEVFGKEPRADVNPDLAVAMGAAVQAALAGGVISSENGLILTDVSPFGLGIQLLEEAGGRRRLIYEPLIQTNTTIPYSFKKSYTLIHDEQQEVEVHLLQDHTGKARLIEDAVETGIRAGITNIPPSRTGEPHTIEIDFSYDINGIAKLTATIPATGQSVDVVYQQAAGRMDEEEKEEARERVNELWKQSTYYKRYESLLSRAERFRPDLAPPQRSKLIGVVNELKSALASDDSDRIEQAGDRLADLMFDLEAGSFNSGTFQ
jgi:molecular chaperone DnaK